MFYSLALALVRQSGFEMESTVGFVTGRFCVISLLMLLGACSGLPDRSMSSKAEDGVRRHEIFVIGHGWHTGVVVPGAFLSRVIPQLKERFGEPDFYEIGWGDAGFYQAEETSVGLALQALFWSQGTVVHVVAVSEAPKRYFAKDEVTTTCVSEAALGALTHYISDSFARAPDDRLIPLATGDYGDSQFYKGTGHYSLLNTCNTWTARSLSSAGMNISPLLKQTAGPVLRHVQANGGACMAEEKPAPSARQ